MNKNRNSATKKLLRILFGLSALIVLAALLAHKMGWIGEREVEREVDTERAEFRTITQLVSASGRIQPEEEVIIRPDVSGEITELSVREGDFVREGDLLLRIKPDIYQAQIDDLTAVLLTQQARMEQARASMLQAEVEYVKNRELYDRDLISELEYLQSSNGYEAQKANFRASEFQIESAEAQLRRAEEELQQTVIRSPRDGTITHLAIEQGERVLGQAQTAGTEMMRIARLEQMEVVVDVNENDIVNVSISDTTDIEVDAYPNRIFEGVVTEIANSAEVSGEGSAEQVTNYKVKIRISTLHNISHGGDELQGMTDSEQPSSLVPVPDFKPGMSATVDVRANTVYDVVSIPIQAVTVRDISQDGEHSEADADADADADAEPDSSEPARGSGAREDLRRVVFVNEQGVAKRIEVETGISDDSYIQVMSGVNSGDEVITGSYRILSRELNDGDRITINDNRQITAIWGD